MDLKKLILLLGITVIAACSGNGEQSLSASTPEFNQVSTIKSLTCSKDSPEMRREYFFRPKDTSMGVWTVKMCSGIGENRECTLSDTPQTVNTSTPIKGTFVGIYSGPNEESGFTVDTESARLVLTNATCMP